MSILWIEDLMVVAVDVKGIYPLITHYPSPSETAFRESPFESRTGAPYV